MSGEDDLLEEQPQAVTTPDTLEAETKQAELEKVYEELNDIHSNLATAGEITTDQVVALESLCPGILTDNYPAGGYSRENYKLAMEEIDFKRIAIIGGIIAAVVAVIVGLLTWLGSFFKASSSASGDRAARAEKNVAAVEKAETENKKAQEELNVAVREIKTHRQPQIDPEVKRKLVEELNQLLMTDALKEHMTPERILEHAEEISDTIFAETIENTQTLLTNELFRDKTGGPLMRFARGFLAGIRPALEKANADIAAIEKWANQYQTAFESQTPAAYVYNTTLYRQLAELGGNSFRFHPETVNAQQISEGVLSVIDTGVEFMDQGSLPVEIRHTDEARRWAHNLESAIKDLVIPDESRKVNDLIKSLEGLISKYTVTRKNIVDDGDRLRSNNTADYLRKVQTELYIIQHTVSRIASKMGPDLARQLASIRAASTARAIREKTLVRLADRVIRAQKDAINALKK